MITFKGNITPLNLKVILLKLKLASCKADKLVCIQIPYTKTLFYRYGNAYRNWFFSMLRNLSLLSGFFTILYDFFR